MNKSNQKPQKTSPAKAKTQKTADRPKFSLRSALKIFALLCFVFFICIFAQYSVSLIALFTIGRETLSQPLPLTLLNALIYSLVLLLVLALPRLCHRLKSWRTSRTELGLHGLPTWTDLGLAPVGFIVYFLLAALLVFLFSLLPFLDMTQAQDLGYGALTSNVDRLLAFLALCIIAPVIEEIVFRGFLYGKLRARIPGRYSLVLSIFLSSLVFAILHGQWSVGVNIFAMAVVLCLMREVTGTIYSGILLHVLKNSIAFFMLYLMI